MAKKFDFSGFATKNGIKCSDGRTILKDAFKHQDGKTVPLVWQHLHNEPGNVLGHAVLENREDGVYCYGSFNDTEAGQDAKKLVEHGDIDSLSIYANNLKEQAKKVIHGAIREVSLVFAGANEGAKIDNLCFAHGEDGESVIDETEAIIYTGLTLSHGDTGEEVPDADPLDGMTDEQKAVVHAMIARATKGTPDEPDGKKDLKHSDDSTVEDVFNTFTSEQKNVVYYLINAALDSDSEPAAHSILDDKGVTVMKKNLFDQTSKKEKRKRKFPEP